MCLKQEHEFKGPDRIEAALALLKPGWAVAFHRGAYSHFCIYLGTCLVSKSECGQELILDFEKNIPVRHLICQLTKRREVGMDGKGDIWIDDFKAAARDSEISVYECDCSALKRSAVVEKCLKCQGETEYSLMKNNCEHFVRSMLENKHECYQMLKFGKLFKDRSLPISASSSSFRGLHGFANSVFVFLLRDGEEEAVKTSVQLRNPQYLMRFAYAKLHPLKSGRNRFVEFLDRKPEDGRHANAKAAARIPAGVELETPMVEPRLRSYTATSPQGFCLVININKYESAGLTSRPGSEADVQRVKSVFEKLDFIVTIAEDLKTHEINRLLNDYASDEALFRHGCFVCFLMAHGTSDSILGSDGEPLELRCITQIFNPAVCPGLKGKPKIFFLHTSEKHEVDLYKGASFDSASHTELQDLTATGSDFLVCRSSFFDSDGGASPSFVQILSNKIETLGKEENLLKIVTSINKEMIENSTQLSSKEDSAATDFASTLTKKFFFRRYPSD